MYSKRDAEKAIPGAVGTIETAFRIGLVGPGATAGVAFVDTRQTEASEVLVEGEGREGGLVQDASVALIELGFGDLSVEGGVEGVHGLPVKGIGTGG